jgi:uncharacterized protein with HEPN domain
MYDSELLNDAVSDIIESIKKIENRSKGINSSDDFLKNEDSMILLDSICMQLIAIGQGVKDIDKLTKKSLFKDYPQIPWRNITGIRDVLSYNYFDLNAQTVFGVCQDNLKEFKEVMLKIKQRINRKQEK